MPTMISEIYDALKEAGASEEKARRAAEVLASHENRFTHVDRALDTLDRKLDRESAELKSSQRLHSWMLGYLVLVTTTLLWRVFT
jgi:Flp pilus assembly protein TadB